MSSRADRGWRIVASVLLGVLALLVALLGLAIARWNCEVACGSEGEQAFLKGLGIAALALGAVGSLLAPAKRWVSLALTVVAFLCCLVSFATGLSHLR